MGKFIVVKDDAVKGTDKHNVTGMDTSQPTPLKYTGIGEYDYAGKITSQLSDFVKADGTAVALKTSKSSLDSGSHLPAAGTNYKPDAPAPPNPATLSFLEKVGEGVPNTAAGSSFVSIGGTAVLLDGDKIDTCDGTGSKGNSTVTAKGQSFVSCSE